MLQALSLDNVHVDVHVYKMHADDVQIHVINPQVGFLAFLPSPQSRLYKEMSNVKALHTLCMPHSAYIYMYVAIEPPAHSTSTNLPVLLVLLLPAGLLRQPSQSPTADVEVLVIARAPAVKVHQHVTVLLVHLHNLGDKPEEGGEGWRGEGGEDRGEERGGEGRGATGRVREGREESGMRTGGV